MVGDTLRMKLKSKNYLSKKEEYQRNLQVRNIIKSIESSWNNTSTSDDDLKEFRLDNGTIKISDRANSNFSNINLIEDRELRNLFKECLKYKRKGEIRKLVRQSKYDFNVFYRTKKALNIPNFDIAKNRQNLELEIIEKYLIEDLTTIELGEIYGFTSQNINNILRRNNIKIKDRYSKRRTLKFATKSDLSQEELEKTLYKKYVLEKKSINDIKKEIGLDEGCIANKLRAMKINVKPSRSKTQIKFTCLWCGKVDFAWTTGGKMQKYCCSSHKNKAKDLRRMKPTPKAMQSMLLELSNTWKEQYADILNKIMEKSVNHEKILEFSNNSMRAEQ